MLLCQKPSCSYFYCSLNIREEKKMTHTYKPLGCAALAVKTTKGYRWVFVLSLISIFQGGELAELFRHLTKYLIKLHPIIMFRVQNPLRSQLCHLSLPGFWNKYYFSTRSLSLIHPIFPKFLALCLSWKFLYIFSYNLWIYSLTEIVTFVVWLQS